MQSNAKLYYGEYLEHLNPRQQEAVLATEGPVSVLAGAGAGKTRVLTARIYHLIRQGVPGDQILAVTFTNKAAREMRERVKAMLGEEDAAHTPFIATFHGLGRELLESYGKNIGVPRYFSIFDRDDSERVITAALKSLDVGAKELSSRAVLARISRAKGEGMTPIAFHEKYGRTSFANRVVADVWQKYDRALQEEKALDFDDLIVLPVRLLAEHEDVRARAQERWRYVHIDEYQDTNELQARLINLLSAQHKNVLVVGDIDQCLIAGTKVTMADGTKTNIESLKKGDLVLSSYGSGNFRASRVSRVVARKASTHLIQIITKEGRSLMSTPEHIHFAGYRLGSTPQIYFTYLMYKQSAGWRLGASQTYTRGQSASMVGFQQRCNQEHGDAVWVIGTHQSPQDARVMEYQLSLSYGIPTIPFIARKGGSANGYVHDQTVIDRIFKSFDTESGARKLLADHGLSQKFPHHQAQSRNAIRRNVTVTLCGDYRGASTLHRIAMVGNDSEGKEKIKALGLSVRSAKPGSASWRFETASKEYGDIEKYIQQLQSVFPNLNVIRNARLGGKKINPKDGNSLPFLPAASIRPGMVLFTQDGGYDTVEKIEWISKNANVYDLDIEQTHNFIANEIITHNCIYTWRGATIENLLSFEKTYPSAKTIVLEHNYRSTKTIVSAANAVIEKNKNRKEKRSVTDNPEGDPITVHIALNAETEALWIAQTIKSLVQKGVPPHEIAVLFRTNFQSRALEEGLLHAGVPYKLLGTRFFERKEVKDVLSWVRLALEPSREADKMRAAQFPSRGIGKTTLGKLAAGKRGELRAGDLAKVEAFETLIQELSHAANDLSPSAFVRLVIEKSGMKTALFEGTEEERERFENIQELATLASRHDALPGKEGISAFVAEAALASDQDEADRDQKKGVMLMTVHAAKGLEFNTVFVAGMEEGLFPHEGMGGDGDRDEEEERRLFYVAMTRAKKKLYLTLARIRKIYGTDYLQEPSSFLEDIDRSLVVYDESTSEKIIQI